MTKLEHDMQPMARTEAAQADSVQRRGSTALPTEAAASELKQAINNLLWMYAPETLTLGEADNLANDILGTIQRGSLKP